jgi:hypothetical protein
LPSTNIKIMKEERQKSKPSGKSPGRKHPANAAKENA